MGGMTAGSSDRFHFSAAAESFPDFELFEMIMMITVVITGICRANSQAEPGCFSFFEERSGLCLRVRLQSTARESSDARVAILFIRHDEVQRLEVNPKRGHLINFGTAAVDHCLESTLNYVMAR
jgi:hypothetical protein